MQKTPKELGFMMPAEWAPHEGTWLTWPHNEQSFPGKIKSINKIWVQMMSALQAGEKIHLNVLDDEMEALARQQLMQAQVPLTNILFHHFQTDDCWIRDYGPIFVKNKKEMAIIDWKFNMWGGKYPPWDLDDVIPQRVAEIYGYKFYEPGIVMEGGSIDVNGQGTLLTTESCLLNKNRNPHLKKSEIEKYLSDYLGVTNILWLGDGIVGDDTDGHVDDLARFVNPTTIVTVVEEDPSDENYKALQDNLKRLQTMKDEQGRLLNIVPLPMPRPVICEDTRLPASYANFYIGNAAVLLPVFNDPADKVAIETLAKFFPDRKIVPIDARDMVWGFGAFHCCSQQQPL